MKPMRRGILIGMIAGALWAPAVVFAPAFLDIPYLPAPAVLPGAFLAPGLVLALMIGWAATRRFFDDALIHGAEPAPGSPADIDQRVLRNTIEQLVLALAIWPFAALTLGGAVAIGLGLSFAVMRILFWIGSRLSPALRSFGFAATFFPTVLAGLWALLFWAV